MSYNGVIDKTTGDLIRAGYTTFDVDASREEFRTDVPQSSEVKISGRPYARWSGTGWVTVNADLFQKKKQKIREMASDVGKYIEGRYNRDQQMSLLALWLEGLDNLWTNRKTKVQQIFNWVKLVMEEFYTKKAAILEAADVDGVEAVTLNLAQFDTTDPAQTVENVKNTVN